MYANECARRHAIFMKLNTDNFEIPSRGIPSGHAPGRLEKEFQINEVSATNAETEWSGNGWSISLVMPGSYRESYQARLLLAVHPHIIPQFNLPILPFSWKKKSSYCTLWQNTYFPYDRFNIPKFLITFITKIPS